MSGWLVSTLQNSRIKALLLEVRWDIESSAIDRTARILIGAQALRLSIIDPEPALRAVIDNPFSHERNRLMDVYGQIEDARNLTVHQTKAIEAQTKRLGVAVPDMIRDRTIEARRSLEIWMATVGSAIAKNGREPGAFIWGKLDESRGILPAALKQLRKTEEQLGTRMYEATDQEILDACAFVPSSYR